MKAGKYSIKEIFINRYLQEIVIPEIQRDYVWGKDQVESILESIAKDFNSYLTARLPFKVEADPQLEADFEEFYKRRKYSSNIGFIYAYNDEEYPGKYFLIDGQQRLTTIYLLLLALANRNKETAIDFRRTYLLENNIKLNYRVREASHDFMTRFAQLVLETDEPATNQNWYHKDYENDETIKNLVSNYNTIQYFIDTQKIDEAPFYQYLQNMVDIWYFDTNISEQGEELYIYINARGEQIQDNENIKADLLGRLESDEEKNCYGLLWEQWQDFFWLNKGEENENADDGFNEFLACISGLENYLSGDESYFYSTDDFDENKEAKKKKGIKVKDVLKNVSLPVVERYVNALQFLLNKKGDLPQYYTYHAWAENCCSEIWKIVNNERTNWYADYNDDDRSTERNKMVFLWSTLYYLTTIDVAHTSTVEVYRAIRKFYLKYHNYIRSVSTIQDQVDLLVDGTVVISVGEEESEESLKTLLLDRYTGADQLHIEEEIWQIEDHKFNLDGKDVGGRNIGHLVDLKGDVTLDLLRKIKCKFREVFPEDKSRYLAVQNILLHYGIAWYYNSPWNYANRRFDSWKRIIRDRKDKDNIERDTFRRFFTDFLNYDGSLKSFATAKNAVLLSNSNLTSLEQKLLWYNQRIGDTMWSQGDFITISYGNQCSLPDWQQADKIFSDEYIIYNTKGNLKGGTPQELYGLLPQGVTIDQQVPQQHAQPNQ